MTPAPLKYGSVLSWTSRQQRLHNKEPPIPPTNRMQPEDKGPSAMIPKSIEGRERWSENFAERMDSKFLSQPIELGL
ncbi:hypothetical protein TNCV_286911 [Trichonephila clavipes]|nr:hypothetical protein TNCV_286911 [Trichonephila clavipes]